MRPLAFAKALAFLLFVATGCSPTKPSPVDGSWTGALTACVNQWNCVFSLSLERTAKVRVSGNWASFNNGAVNGSVSGTVSGSSVALTLTPSNPSYCGYRIDATASSTTSMDGTYVAINCAAFPGLGGTFTARK